MKTVEINDQNDWITFFQCLPPPRLGGADAGGAGGIGGIGAGVGAGNGVGAGGV